MAAVPYIFSNVPGGTSIPLWELDENFAYCINNNAWTDGNFAGNVNVGGFLNVAGPFTFNGTMTIHNSMVNQTANIQGFTGSGLMVLNNAPTLIAPNIGTPTFGNLVNCTGLPLMGITGFGPGVATWLMTPSAANLRSCVQGTTGSGNLVFSNNAHMSDIVLTNPDIGTPSYGNLMNCTGLNLTAGFGVTGILPIGYGGTGATTANAALNNLLPSQVGNAGKYLQTDGFNTSWMDNAGGTVTSITMSPGVTGLTINGGTVPVTITTSGTFALGGVVAIGSGGTGNTTRQGAMNTLAGGVTLNNFLYGDGTNIKLGPLTAAQIAMAGTLSNNTTGSAGSISATNTNQQFNSIGIGGPASGTMGTITSTGQISITTAGQYFVDMDGTLHPLVLRFAVVPVGPSINFTGIPSWVNRVTVMMALTTTAPGSQSPTVQLGTSLGYVTTGYTSYCANIGAANKTTTNGFNTCYDSAGSFSLVWTIVRVNQNNNNWMATVTGTVNNSNPQFGTGSVVLPAALNSVAVTFTAAGSYTAGIINVMYE